MPLAVASATVGVLYLILLALIHSALQVDLPGGLVPARREQAR